MDGALLDRVDHRRALIATVGVSACFAVNAASFLPPLFVLLCFRPEHRAPISPGARGLAAIREGLSYVRRRPALAFTILIARASGLLFNPGVAVPVFASRSLGLGSVGYGALVAAFGLGAIPGALANTLVQLRAAPALRGRVMALWTMALPGMNPVTALLAGAVTQLAGPRAGFGLGGAALVAAAALGLRALSE